VGVLMWITAIKQYRREDDPDAPPPTWMTAIGAVTPLKAFGFGALLVAIGAKQWVFTLGAINVIREAALGQPEAAVAFLLYVLGASALILAPSPVRLVAPRQSKAALEAGGHWLEEHNRVIVIAVSAVFGTFCLWRGVTGLIGG
jgi:hypothetical protein